MPNKTRHSGKMKQAFLKAYAECGIVSKSAKAARTDRTNHYRWLHEDPDYAKAFALADQMAVSNLEDEARFRATEGLRKYKFTSKGEPVYIRCNKSHPEAIVIDVLEDGTEAYGYHYYEYDRSDLLLITLLNAAMPDRFGKYRHQHSGSIDYEVSGELSLNVIQDDDWYGNNDRITKATQSNGNGSGGNGHASTTAPASSANPLVAESVQGNGVRSAVGQNGNGTSNGHAGAR